MRKTNSLFILFIFAVSLTLSGCSSQPELPSINYSTSKTYNYGQVVWRDLVTPDPKVAAEFYQKVFGWTSTQLRSGDNAYWLFKKNGKPVAGMFLMTEAKKNAGGEWIQYYSVSSIDDAVRKSKAAGGNLIINPLDVQGRGMVALLTDPQNAYFALIKSANGDPAVTEPTDFEFLWNELWSNDVEKSEVYYKSIFNSKVETRKDDDRTYTILENNNKESSGIIKNPVENVRSNWVQYVKVSDIKSVEQKVKDAGGHLMLEADSSVRKGTVSIFTDPTGAPIAIQKWPIE